MKSIKIVQGDSLYQNCQKVETGLDEVFLLYICQFSGKLRSYDFFVVIQADFFNKQFDSKNNFIRIPGIKNPYSVRVDKYNSEYSKMSLERAELICPTILQYLTNN